MRSIFSKGRRRSPRPTAMHEAGHAVVAWLMAQEEGDEPGFDAVFIDPEGRIGANEQTQESAEAGEVYGRVEGAHFYIPLGFYFPSIHWEGADQPNMANIVRWNHRRMEMQVLMVLAGIAAEARHRHWARVVAILDGGQSDWKHAKKAVSDFVRTEEERDVALDELLSRSSRLIRMPAVWATITSFADALVEHRRIEAEEAAELLRSSYARHGGSPRLAGQILDATGWRCPSCVAGIEVPLEATAA